MGAMKRTLRTSLTAMAGVLLSGCSVSAVLSALTVGSAARLLSVLIETTAFAVATVIFFAATRHREALVRSRFEQHLAPAVVRRIFERPRLLKLCGERREVTALFTDIEGFTAMTH